MKKFLPLLLLSVILFDASAQHTYNEITLPALMKKRNGNASNMVIVDVRSNAEYYDSSSRFKNGNIGRIKDVVHIELQELEKGGESLKQLDYNWFEPLWAMLRQGEIDRLTLTSLGNKEARNFSVRRSDFRKFWRRPKAISAYAAG